MIGGANKQTAGLHMRNYKDLFNQACPTLTRMSFLSQVLLGPDILNGLAFLSLGRAGLTTDSLSHSPMLRLPDPCRPAPGTWAESRAPWRVGFLRPKAREKLALV